MANLTTPQILFILQGAGWTLLLSVFGFAGGCILGLPLALASISRWRWLRLVTGLVVGIVQGIPLPILMFAVYFGASLTGYDPPALVAAGSALGVYSAAFLAEIWKGSIRAVPRTQWEAADCLALTAFDTLRLVILPQAVRIATPPSIGFFVQMIKNTSYATVLAFAELTYSSRVVNNSINEPFLIFTLAGAIYFVICFPLSVLSRRLERSVGRLKGAME